MPTNDADSMKPTSRILKGPTAGFVAEASRQSRLSGSSGLSQPRTAGQAAP